VSAAEAGADAAEASRAADAGAGDGRAPLRVIVADDQRVVREGLTLMLGLIDGIEPVGAAADGEEALAMVAAERPDVVLMDLRMPRLDGIEATRRLAETHPGIGVVALTTYADDETIVAALQAGARGYLTKDAGAEQIRSAVERVAAGEAAIDPAVQRQLIAAVRREPEPAPSSTDCDELPDGLTPREAEVLELIAAGLSNGEIADRLVVSAATVKSHVNHLFAKIGARDRAQAVAYAYQHELVAEDD
jgi:DNA-binding NarL/FixJ family response regulator